MIWYGGGGASPACCLPPLAPRYQLMEEDGSHDDDGKGSAEGLGMASSAQPLPFFLERKVSASR